MSITKHSNDQSSFKQHLDWLCDEFDHAWSESRRPKLSEFIEQVDADDIDTLLMLLIPIDLEYRQQNGELCTANDYAVYGKKAVEFALSAIESMDEGQNGNEFKDHFPEIENFRFEKKIGEGGMGSVFLAEQLKPVRRKVAVKVVKSGHNSEEIVNRFEAERQALALMDHPYIARVLDAGKTSDGLPYFAMEWVDGIPITDYFDNAELSVRDRIREFLKVCQAVQHAHQRGIIHRDLKPSNILVAESNGLAIPKVIDFGLAKAMEDQVWLTDKTIATQFGTIVGSPAYMSPEQAELHQRDLDTRTDIYSLGVIFFEMLTGSTPITRDVVRNNTPLKTLEQIREDDAPRPSSRLASQDDDAEQPSHVRKTTPSRLIQSLRGELDWIALKALERDRKRRYETVLALHDDLRSYLDNEPVQARPPSSYYLLLKSARKHKTFLLSAAMFFIVLLSTTIIIGRLYFFEREARALTEKKNARAKYYSAMGFWSQNRSKEALETLNSIDDRFRFVEWRLAHNQFQNNCKTLSPMNSSMLQAAKFSPDGQWIAAAGGGPNVEVYNAESGQLIHRFGQFDSVYALAFDPGGTMIAVGTNDGRISMWDIKSESVVAEFDNTIGKIHTIVFSQNGKLLAAAGGKISSNQKNRPENYYVHVWSVDDKRKVVDLIGHEGRVNSISFLNDDQTLVSASRDKTVRLWNVHTGVEVEKIELSSYMLSIAADAKGKKIAAGSANNKLYLWDVENPNPGEFKITAAWQRDAHGFEGDTIDSLDFSPDGTKLASGSFDRTIKIWETKHGNEIRVLRGHVDQVTSVDFSDRSNQLVSASLDGTAKIWNIELQTESRVVEAHTQSVNAIAFSPDSRLIASAAGLNEFDSGLEGPGRLTDNSIRVWNHRKNESQQFSGHRGPLTDIQFCPSSHDGDEFVSSSIDGTIRFWSRDCESCLQSLNAHDGLPVNAIAFHPSGAKLASGGADGQIKIWDCKSLDTLLQLSNHSSPIVALAWSHDGKYIASGEKSGKLILWDAETGKQRWSRSGHLMYCVAFSFDNQQIAAGQDKLTIYETSSGKTLKILGHSRLGLYFVSYYQNAKVPRLLTGGRQGQCWLWDSESWEELNELNIDSNENWNFCYDGAFSPDGKMIATANRDGTIRIWNTSDQ